MLLNKIRIKTQLEASLSRSSQVNRVELSHFLLRCTHEVRIHHYGELKRKDIQFKIKFHQTNKQKKQYDNKSRVSQFSTKSGFLVGQKTLRLY